MMSESIILPGVTSYGPILPVPSVKKLLVTASALLTRLKLAASCAIATTFLKSLTSIPAVVDSSGSRLIFAVVTPRHDTSAAFMADVGSLSEVITVTLLPDKLLDAPGTTLLLR